MATTDDSSDDGSGGGGDTLKITDQYLKDFANTQIKSFLDSARSDPSLKAVENFGGPLSDGSGEGGQGVYSKLLGGSLDSAKTLQAQFQSLCSTLDGMVKQLESQMGQAQLDLQVVDSTLNNAEDEALTTAQMMQVLNDVLNGINSVPTTSSPTPDPKTT
jgi:hypothetical protein